MSKIFITSDNHFSHKNIHRFCPLTRPDPDWKIMDEKMIHMWQSQVGQNDIVYLLGDVFFCSSEEAIKIMHRLPGQKHLIYGNHDNAIRSNSTLRNMFVSVQEYKEVKFDGNDLILFHYPIQEWNKMHRGAIHCYGHIHHATSNVGGRTVNVCVDSPDLAQFNNPYRLYHIEEVVKFGLKHEIRGHHDKTL